MFNNINFSPLLSHDKFFPVWSIDVPYIKSFDTSLLQENKWIVDQPKNILHDYDHVPEQLRFWYKRTNCCEEIQNVYTVFNETSVLNFFDNLMHNKDNAKILDQLYQYNRHQSYKKPSRWLRNKIECETSIVKDISGMSIKEHVDTRIYLGTFVCNLKDNTSSTKFLKCDTYGPTEKGTGVFWLNDNSTLHSIDHFSDDERLIAYTQIRFKVLD